MSDIIIGGKKINMAMLNAYVLNNPVLTHSPTGILHGKIAGVNGQGCVREVSLAQVSCILMYVYVAPPGPHQWVRG